MALRALVTGTVPGGTHVPSGIRNRGREQLSTNLVRARVRGAFLVACKIVFEISVSPEHFVIFAISRLTAVVSGFFTSSYYYTARARRIIAATPRVRRARVFFFFQKKSLVRAVHGPLPQASPVRMASPLSPAPVSDCSCACAAFSRASVGEFGSA